MARSKRSIATSRRTLSGLGAVGIAVGTIAITAGVTASPAHAAPVSSKALAYDCSATVFGSTLDQGVWTATVSSNLPAQVAPGAKLPAPEIKAAVTSSDGATGTLRSLKETAVDGTSQAVYSVAGAVVDPGSRTADLTIPNTPVPATGDLKTTATGTGSAETAASSPGKITVAVGNFSANIQTYQGDTKSLVIPVDCTLQAGQNTTLGTITVGAPPTSTPPTSTPPTSTPPTSTPPTSTATGTATSTGVTGPPIITDGGSTGGGVNSGIVGGAAVAAMGVGALGFGIRRRLTDKK